MKIVFFTSVLNHHQLPLCLEMNKALGDNFNVVTTMELEKQRVELGYVDYSKKYKFCIKMNSSEKNFQLAYTMSQDYDVLIAGVIDEKFIKDRVKKIN